MFPFDLKQIQLSGGRSIDAQLAHQKIGPLLTVARREKIEKVVAKRNFTNVVVLENIYDRGNMSAVMRTTEAFGLGQVHVIELSDKLKESQRTTAGADKWLEVQRWKSTASCLQELRRQGKKIYVTHLDERAIPISDIDWTADSALVLGNEKEGASPEALALADQTVIIPMVGFVQSFNISVAGALCLAEMTRKEKKPLSPEQKLRLEAEYFIRTLDSAEDILINSL